MTWQAYNLRDGDGDGKGDTWYADWKTKTVRLGRPYLNRGVPYNFRRYDLPFLHWLAWTERASTSCRTPTSRRAASARALADAYDLIVFPGHHEYVTTREYDVIEGYRDLGGNLVFLSANNFFWQVVRRGNVMTKTELGATSDGPRLPVGAQYRGNGNGTTPAVDRARRSPAATWLFAGTGLEHGSTFGERRDRDRQDDARVAARRPGARRDSGPLRTRVHRADDVLRDAQRARRSSPRAPSTSCAWSTWIR